MAYTFDSKSFVTAAQFEAWTGILASTLTAAEQLKVEMKVDGICDQMIRYCGLDGFKSTSYTEIFDGNGSDLLIPNMYPVSAITSIKFAPDGVFTTATAWDSTEYAIDSTGRYITLRDGILSPRGRGSIQIVYTAGYSNIPKALIMGFFRQYDFISGVGDGSAGVKSKGKMNEQIVFDTLDGGLVSEVRSILEPFKKLEPSSSSMFMRCT